MSAALRKSAALAPADAAGRSAAAELCDALANGEPLSAEGAARARAALREFYDMGQGLHPATRDAFAGVLFAYIEHCHRQAPPPARAPKLRLIRGGGSQ
ncbi:MAG: hypothetical protein KA387_04530 [Rubrivivax sp.]|jgi:hypothetical protein|nr:hypothetical protein [Rubrivivax sp.]MBP6319427.1 hypothetical protein [Rubrivivax sp.]